MKNRMFGKVLALVIIISLVCALALTGCKIKKKTPEEIFANAVALSADSFDKKSSIDDTLKMVKNGLFTVEIGGFSIYAKDTKVALGVEYLKDKFGLDLAELKDKFPKSIFGTEGGNYSGFSKKDEQEFLDSFDKIISMTDGISDFSDEFTKIITDNSTMTAEYNKAVELISGSKKADILNISLTAGQVKEIVKELFGEMSEMLDSFSAYAVDFDDIDDLFDGKLNDGDEAALLKLYTDVKTGEIIGGVFTAHESDDKDTVFDIDVTRSDDSVKYALSRVVDEERHEVAVSLSNSDGVERMAISSDDDTLAEFIVDRNAKTVTLKSDGSTLFTFDYDVVRADDGSIATLSIEFEVNSSDIFGGVFGQGFSSSLFGFDSLEMASSPDYAPEAWYESSAGYGSMKTVVKINYTADGEMPSYRDVLSLTEEDLNEIFTGLFSY